MLKSKSIRKSLEVLPLTVEFLNFIFNYNKQFDWEKQLEFKRLYEEKYEEKYDYAIFQTDSEFYQKASKSLKCSEIYLKRYIRVFRETEIIKRLRRVGRKGYLYADGYYSNTPVGRKKYSFLKNTPYYKWRLITLPYRLKNRLKK
jgi:hypothetical protein